ncbi:hypothetical protein [Ruegeria arenilitoris]|uniref:hypothetical protein n=1 Tax=Ruegeria arenilitoris TaxID=1173585 RepID=UPI00147AEB74|nr:hypothetical protein [Ruegeria arenilitoris]
MSKTELQIPEIVWDTLHRAHVKLMTGAGYPEFAAVEFADTIVSWRKSLVKQLSPEAALLSELIWAPGEGRETHWGFELIIPPIPKDIATLA